MRGPRQRYDLNAGSPYWAVALYCIYRGVRLTVRTCRKVRRATRFAIFRRKALATRLPASKPLVDTCGSGGNSRRHAAAVAAASRGAISLLDLPPEIIQQIFDLALPGRWILQPTYGGTLRGSQPEHWPARQHIRTDRDPPSESLSNVVALGGSGLKPNPRPNNRGQCVKKGPLQVLIYGTAFTRQRRSHCGGKDHQWLTTYLNLMRTCRLAYLEVLHRLYGECTISLFGTDMVHYFLRNASPEGLCRVRYLHVALVVPMENWGSKRQQQRKTIVQAFHLLAKTLVNLQQLDVEIAFTPVLSDPPLYTSRPSHPRDPVVQPVIEKEHVWKWLRNDVLSQFQGLEKLVLRLPVYQECPHKRERFHIMPEQLWDESEYGILKDSVLLR